MMANTADAVGAKATDRVLAIVPMFHVNAWGLPYAVPMLGAAMLMPGFRLDAPSVLQLMNEERATVAVGVPTVWLNLLNHLRETGARLTTLKRVVIGGSAMPRAMLQDLPIWASVPRKVGA